MLTAEGGGVVRREDDGCKTSTGNNCEFFILSFLPTCLFLCLKNIRKKHVTAYLIKKKIFTLKIISSHCQHVSEKSFKTAAQGESELWKHPRAGGWRWELVLIFIQGRDRSLVSPKVQLKISHTSFFYEPCKQIGLLLFPVCLFPLLVEYISVWATPPYHTFISMSLHSFPVMRTTTPSRTASRMSNNYKPCSLWFSVLSPKIEGR